MRRRVLPIRSLCLILAVSLPLSEGRAQWGGEAADGFDCVIYPSLVADLGSSATGLLERVPVDRGDTVREGEIVAVLESGAEQAVLELARIRAESRAEVALREAGASFAERRRLRSEELKDRRLVSESDVDERETEARIGRIQLRQANENAEVARVELRRAEELLARRTIRSPFDGVVVERHKTIGELVENKPILSVARLDPLHVEVIVPVEEIDRLRPGLQAEVSVAEREGVFWTATVSRLDPVADVASGTYGVRLALPNPDHAIPSGRRCRVRFLESEAPSPGPTLAEEKPGRDSSGTSTAVARAADSDDGPAPAPAAPSLGAGRAVADGAERPPTRDGMGAGVGPEDSCRWVGPIADMDRAKSLSARLSDEGHDTTLVERRSVRERGVQVVSALQDSRADAVDLADRLRAAGVIDLFLSSGQSVRRVALGLFEDRRAAERRVEELRAKGFDVELEPWLQSTKSYYLAARLPTDEDLPDILSAETVRSANLKIRDADGSLRDVNCATPVAGGGGTRLAGHEG